MNANFKKEYSEKIGNSTLLTKNEIAELVEEIYNLGYEDGKEMYIE